jgi:mRNA interferase YafQ
MTTDYVYTPVYATKFKKDMGTCKKRSYDLCILMEIMEKILNDEPLDFVKNRPHTLHGKYKGKTECHLTPDWLLIYELKKDSNEVYFIRTGTHSDLF